jgi:hypothetical protein
MPLSFPDAPSVNDTYTAGDIEYTWNGTTWYISNRVSDARYGAATGGDSSATITVGGESYTLLTFLSSGTLTVGTAGLFDVLIVGGGGAGGLAGDWFAKGGGGAGGYREYSKVYFDTNQTVTVGAGSSVGTKRGSSSRCGQLFAGGGGTKILYTEPNNGASGAGGQANPGLGDGVSGNNGGTGNAYGQGGGGGAGAAGSNGASAVGGDGGDGLDASAFRGESATTTYYAGGGGGAVPPSAYGGGTRGLGGLGGGGNGSDPSNSPTNGTANTGGGGGGGNQSTAGSGGSGIVLVRFKN